MRALLAFALVVAVSSTTVAVASPQATLENISTFRGQHGLTVVREEARVDGIPVHGTHTAVLKNAAGEIVARNGRAPALVAELEQGVLTLQGRHAQKSATRTGAGTARRTLREPVWFLHGSALKAAYREWRTDLTGAEPHGELVIVDAATGAVFHRVSTIFQHAPQGFYTYTHPDGRPLLSPYGKTWPHPDGVPNGWRPTIAETQATIYQADIAAAIADPWLANDATITSGNNVIVFFNSIIEPDGTIDDLFGPRFGPGFQADDGDFFAKLNSATDFVYSYDPADSANDYYQWPQGIDGVPPGLPDVVDPNDEQLNAKIVQAFYSANWMHDFLHSAGFDEAAGNGQQSNYGRGGIEGDALIIHAGFFTTFVAVNPDGESPWMALGINDRSTSRRDASFDFSVLAHEYGHHVLARMAGMYGGGTAQMRALHEGIADFFSLVVGVDAGDDFSDVFPVGQYYNLDYVHHPSLPVVGVATDAMYYGIRRYPYSTDLSKNPLVFSNLVQQPTLPFYDWKGRGPVLNEPHTAGEVFTAALFECFGAVVEANTGTDFEELRLRMMGYLLGGLALFPEEPTFLEARNALFTYIRAADATDYAACRGGFAKRGLGAGAVGPVRTSADFMPVLNGFTDTDIQLTLLPGLQGPSNAREMVIVVRNTGFETVTNILVTFEPELSNAVTMTGSASLFVNSLAPEQSRTFRIPLRIDVNQLPVVGTTVPNRAFNYTVTASIAGAPAESNTVVERSELVVGMPARVAFATDSVRVPDGASTVTLTVERTGEGTEAIEVDYRHGGGSAHEGVNFAPFGGTLTWADGDMSPKTITVTNIRRAQSGFDVLILVSLTNPSAAAEIGDPALIRVTIPGNPNREGGGGTFGGWLILSLLTLVGLRVRTRQRR